MTYYKDLVTGKSFELLKEINRKYEFILIGGWAVFLYTQALKSKDIDFIICYEELEKIRKDFNLVKNDRLKKYEVNLDEIDVDIYVPFYSEIGIPVEKIEKYTRNVKGFTVPQPEILLILKQRAYLERQGSAKGEKDKIDIISLLSNVEFDFQLYKKFLKEFGLADYINELEKLLKSITKVTELDLNEFQISKLKKKINHAIK